VAATHTILLVVGDEAARTATAGVLETAGYVVFQAENGTDALSELRVHRPSLVLLGTILADICGTELLREIRADAALEEVSVVFFSTQTVGPDDQVQGLDCGGDGYIVYPIGNMELVARVRAHLRQQERIDRYRTSEARIRTLIEQQVDAVLVVDRLGTVQYANPAAADLFGRRGGDLDGAAFGFPIVSGDDTRVQELDIARRGQLAAVTEMRVTPIEWEGQQAWIATLRDITARRAAEQAERESRALLDMATTVARLGAWMLNVVTGTRVWSDRTREILDVEPGLTLPLAETIALIAPEHRANVSESFEACVRSGTPFDIEADATTVQGRRIHLRWFGEAVRDETGRIVRLQGAFQDITERKLAEERIARSERRFRELTEAMPMMVWTANSDGSVDYLNRRFFEYTGLFPDRPLSQCWRQAVPSEDLKGWVETWERALRSGEAVEIEFRIRRGSDRALRWHVVRAVAICDDAGSVGKWYGTAMDIHAARLLREEARYLAEHLTKARDEAEQANQAKSRFLAGISHELRTPLSGILGYAQLLQLEGGLTPSQAVRVHAMLDAGTHLREMINSVLDLSQIEAGRLEMHPGAVDLRDAAVGCLDLVRPAAEAKGLTLHLVEAADVPRQILADSTRLREVLLNLLGNAVKFTEHGSVEVRLRTTGSGARLRVDVTDTGPGIPVELRRRLFQDFERLGAEVTGAVEGAGLGLALSARLVALMGGNLAYLDNPGGGAMFCLDLPLITIPNSAFVPATAGRTEPAVRKLNLLVVDDIAMNREIASAFLRDAGHAVACVESGREAVEAAAVADYDVVLMDVRMPGMDGLEAARRIRALTGARGEVPLIAMTAQVFAEQVEDCRRAGMGSHLAKPFTQDELLVAVERAVTVGEARQVSSPAGSETAKPERPAQAEGSAVAEAPEAAPSVREVSGSGLPVWDRAAFARTAGFLTPEIVSAHMQALEAGAASLRHGLCEPSSSAAGAGGLAEAAHALAGSAGQCGFQRLAHAAKCYEWAADSDSSDTPVFVEGLLAAIEASLPHMHGSVSGIGETGDPDEGADRPVVLARI
jgi:PAS domain S-box-containing protein